MCLIVTHVPYSKDDGLIVPCYKSLEMRWYTDDLGRTKKCFTTPAMSCKVPDDGWMFVDDKYPSVWRDREIGNGAIHAYTNESCQVLSWPTRMPAYAFGVIAYECFTSNTGVLMEYFEELCCHALYVPKADRSGKRRAETVREIEKLLKKRTLTSVMVKELHPDLRKLL